MKKENTFIIKIKEQQHATWQGCLYWVGKDKKCNFRSLLEMIKLMDEVVENDGKDVSDVS